MVTPPGTRRLEILPPHDRPGGAADIAGLLELLRKRPGVLQATIFGEAIHALVAEDRTPADLGLEERQVRPAEPSLEDVFVALSRAQAEMGERPA